MAALHELMRFYRGDTWTIEACLHYADGTPFNLGAGALVVWELRDHKSNVALELSLSSGITVIDPSDTPPFKCLITVTPTQSALIAPGRYSDQLRATDPAGVVSTQSVGNVEIASSFFIS